MEKDGFKIEFRAEQIEKIRTDPGTHLELTREPAPQAREEPQEKQSKGRFSHQTTERKPKAS